MINSWEKITEKRKEFKESRIAIKLEARSCMEQDVPIRRGKERDLTICLAITHMRENNLKRFFFFFSFLLLINDTLRPPRLDGWNINKQKIKWTYIHTQKEEKKKVSHNQARTLATSTCPLRFALDVVTDSQAIAVFYGARLDARTRCTQVWSDEPESHIHTQVWFRSQSLPLNPQQRVRMPIYLLQTPHFTPMYTYEYSIDEAGRHYCRCYAVHPAFVQFVSKLRIKSNIETSLQN